MMIIPPIEIQSKEAIKSFQETLLQDQLIYLYTFSPYYKALFDKHGIDISTIKTLEDLRRIPFTTKDDLQIHNHDFICVDKSELIDYVTTSGTLGDPVTFALTDKDLTRLAYNEAISLSCAGITDKDIIQLTATMDRRFMAGLAYFMGARQLKAGVVRIGSGMPELQWDSIKRMSSTVLIAVPSFIIKIIEYAENHQIDHKKSTIKKVVCIGEPIRNDDFTLNTLGMKIRERWDVELFSTYASTEMSTAFTECIYGAGGHLHPELVIVELVDENDEPATEGVQGELVITTLGVEGMPLLRFKTGDVCRIHTGPCHCGRHTPRLGPIKGRKKQMIKYKGTTLYPAAINNLLHAIEEVKSFVTEVYSNDLGTDELVINVHCSEDGNTFFEEKIKAHFRANLRVLPVIRFCTAEYIDILRFSPTSRKPLDFIDNRKSLS